MSVQASCTRKPKCPQWALKPSPLSMSFFKRTFPLKIIGRWWCKVCRVCLSGALLLALDMRSNASYLWAWGAGERCCSPAKMCSTSGWVAQTSHWGPSTWTSEQASPFCPLPQGGHHLFISCPLSSGWPFQP